MPNATDIVLKRFVDDLAGLYGKDLVSVVLYGSAVAGDYVEGQSNINCLVVLRTVTPESLRLSTKALGRWRRDRIVTPLFLDPAYIKTACDVFPIEFFDIKERHRILHGEDFLQNLTLSAARVAAQCEQEIKAKVLRLRQLYLEHGDSPRDLRKLLVESIGSFLVLFRALLRSRDVRPPFDPEAILAELNERGLALAATAAVVNLKRTKTSVADPEVHGLFARYLDDIRAVVDFIERHKRDGGRP